MNRARYLWQLAWLVAFVVLWVDEERHLIPGYDMVGAVVAGTEISVALFLGVMSVVLLVGYAFYGLALAVTYAVKLALSWLSCGAIAYLFNDDLDAVAVTLDSRYSPPSVAKLWPPSINGGSRQG